jgi:hypothetical protein
MKISFHFVWNACGAMLVSACASVQSQEGRLLVSPLLTSELQQAEILRSGQLGSVFGEICVVEIDEATIARLRSPVINLTLFDPGNLPREGPEFSIINSVGEIFLVFSSSYVVDFDRNVYLVESRKLEALKKALERHAGYPACLANE